MTRDSIESEEKSSRSYWAFVLWPVAALLNFLHVEATAVDTNFYQRFLEASNTAKGWFIWDSTLVDTNNYGPVLTNRPLLYAKFSERGELAGIKLGMTMGEVVTAWGKPHTLYPYCGIGPRFW